MKNYIILLRGINVGGHNRLSMSELRELLSNNGYQSVSTYIQSGNIFIRCSQEDAKIISKHIASLIHQKFGLQLPVLVCTKQEIEKCIKSNPFIKLTDDLKKLHVIFLNQTPDNNLVSEVQDFKYKNDRFYINEKFIYLYYPDGSRNSKLNTVFFEKKLNVITSARNWKTTLKLNELST